MNNLCNIVIIVLVFIILSKAINWIIPNPPIKYVICVETADEDVKCKKFIQDKK